MDLIQSDAYLLQTRVMGQNVVDLGHYAIAPCVGAISVCLLNIEEEKHITVVMQSTN